MATYSFVYIFFPVKHTQHTLARTH